MKTFVDIHFQVPEELSAKLKKRLKEYGVSQSQVLRLLAKDWADGHIQNKHNSEL